MLTEYAVELGTLTLVPSIAPAPTLQQVRDAEAMLRGLVAEGAVEAVCPVRHFFAPGQYIRECTIPAGSAVVGKQHRHGHPVFLMHGTVRINTDRGAETISAPHIWISPPDAKRALFTLTDCVFATVHLNPTDTTDLDAIEAEVIVPESIAYDGPQEAGPFHIELQEAYA